MTRHGRLPPALPPLASLPLLAFPFLVSCSMGHPDLPPDDLADIEGEAAEAFLAAEPYFDAFVAITLPPAMPADPAVVKSVLKGWLDEKSRLLAEARDAYEAVVRLGDPHWAAAATCRVGELHVQFARELSEAPLPTVVHYELDMSKFKGVSHDEVAASLAAAGLRDRLIEIAGDRFIMEHVLTPDEATAYDYSFEEMALPFASRARDVFSRCVADARRDGVTSTYTKRCEEGLAALGPEPEVSEPTPRVRPGEPD